MISEEENRLILGSQEPSGRQWEKNNWALAIEAGKKLHSEYVLIIKRGYDVTGYLQFVLINVDTEKIFKDINDMDGKPFTDWLQTYETSLNKIFHDANEDLLATANRKGRIASKELAEAKKEIQELMAGVGEGKTTIKITKEKKPATETATTQKEKQKLKKVQSDQDKKVVKVPKETQPAPQAKPPPVDVNKQEKIARLEERLANLMATLSQLEIMKNQLEEQRKKSDLLVKELAERDQREKMLLAKIEDSSKAPPVIVLASPKDNSSVEFNFIHLSGVAEDANGIKQLEIFINNKLLTKGSERGLSVAKVKHPGRLEFKERIPLEKGINRLKIRAIDTDGLFSEKILSVHYTERRKNMWAVVIGINTYPNIRELKYAVNDARVFYDHLVKNNHIPAENVTLLLNQDATLLKIRSTLGTILKNKAGKDDMAVIFFAGHGATERDAVSPDGDGLEKYLLPFDADIKDLYATALPMGELARIFNRIRSERLIFIADACYSGASGGRTISMTGTRASISESFINRIAGGKGRVIITASGANEVSVEKDELQHGVFTHFLIKGLKGPADVDKDGLVTVDEAYNYVSEHVPQATAQEQHPVKKGTVEGQLIMGIVE
ncbi:caspase family protein [Thermodesulfobacteriota bacterium]